MNGIIHTCSHPNDDNPSFRITEDKIFSDIFHYLEILFRIVKPQKVMFMAVDGVAPRAKMNQQRGRRFRSAKEAEDVVRKVSSFDLIVLVCLHLSCVSNCSSIVKLFVSLSLCLFVCCLFVSLFVRRLFLKVSFSLLMLSLTLIVSHLVLLSWQDSTIS